MGTYESNIYGLTEEDERELIEMENEEEAAKLASEINAIKRTTAQNVLSSAIEIGRLLCEAKEKVSFGEWGKWLKSNVAYSVTTANNMMRLYKERTKLDQIDLFGNNDFSIFEGLNPSQALALLDIPAEERREFAEENDIQNMSVRELQAAIRERDAEKARADAAEEELAVYKESDRDITAERDKLLDEISELEEKLSAAEESSSTDIEGELKKLRSELESKHKAELDKKLSEAALNNDKKLAEAKKKSEADAAAVRAELEKEKERIIKEERERAELASGERIKELEARLASARSQSSPYLVRFKVHMEAFQNSYADMLRVTEEAEGSEPEVGAKLRELVKTLIGALG